jgi:excisionase family DNA binding protein
MSLEEPPKTVREACRDWLGGKASERTLYIAIHDGLLRAAKPKGCKSWLVEKPDVIEWWEAEKCRAAKNPRDFSSNERRQDSKSGLSVTERNALALASIEETISKRKKRSPPTSPKNGKPPKA